MARKPPTQFRPKDFLSQVGVGKALLKCKKNQIVFSQGDASEAVFYVQEGKVKLTVLSQRGKEAVVAILERESFFW
jgi:CRP/FNR family transcriptional regulator, cyclic AMP receptor protein